jgi:hypothetical protein
MFPCDNLAIHLYSILFISFILLDTDHDCYEKINMTSITSRAGTAYPSRTLQFTPAFKWGSCYSMLSRLLFVLFLLTIVLSVLTFPDIDYPFGILKLFLNSDDETGHVCYEKKV